MAVEFVEIKPAWRSLDGHHVRLADGAVHNTLILVELALEVKVSKVARRSIGAWARRLESWIAAPLRALPCRPEVLRDHRVEVGADVLLVGHSTRFLVIARPRLPVIQILPPATCVDAGCLRITMAKVKNLESEAEKGVSNYLPHLG